MVSSYRCAPSGRRSLLSYPSHLASCRCPISSPRALGDPDPLTWAPRMQRWVLPHHACASSSQGAGAPPYPSLPPASLSETQSTHPCAQLLLLVSA